MIAKFFADSNVVLYTIGKDARKATIARDIISRKPAVSAQVVNECVSVCLRKLSFSREQAYAFAKAIMGRTDVLPIDEPTIDKAGAIAIRYQLAHWDALIIAAALLAECETLYSEDLQHNQLIDDQLRIINPFLT